MSSFHSWVVYRSVLLATLSVLYFSVKRATPLFKIYMRLIKSAHLKNVLQRLVVHNPFLGRLRATNLRRNCTSFGDKTSVNLPGKGEQCEVQRTVVSSPWIPQEQLWRPSLAPESIKHTHEQIGLNLRPFTGSFTYSRRISVLGWYEPLQKRPPTKISSRNS